MKSTENNTSAKGRKSRPVLICVGVVLAATLAMLMGLGSHVPASRPEPEDGEPFRPPPDPADADGSQTIANASSEPRSAPAHEAGNAPGPGDRDEAHPAADRSSDGSNPSPGSRPGRGEVPHQNREASKAGDEPGPGDATVFVLDATGAPLSKAYVMKRDPDGGATSARCNHAGRAVLKDVPNEGVKVWALLGRLNSKEATVLPDSKIRITIEIPRVFTLHVQGLPPGSRAIAHFTPKLGINEFTKGYVRADGVLRTTDLRVGEAYIVWLEVVGEDGVGYETISGEASEATIVPSWGQQMSGSVRFPPDATEKRVVVRGKGFFIMAELLEPGTYVAKGVPVGEWQVFAHCMAKGKRLAASAVSRGLSGPYLELD